MGNQCVSPDLGALFFKALKEALERGPDSHVSFRRVRRQFVQSQQNKRRADHNTIQIGRQVLPPPDRE